MRTSIYNRSGMEAILYDFSILNLRTVAALDDDIWYTDRNIENYSIKSYTNI
jgi:predicted nuclease of restriction endonuclease-like (RecB) superfamily